MTTTLSERASPGPARVDASPSLERASYGDAVFRTLLTLAALAVPVLLGFLVYELWAGARIAIDKFGLDFVTSSTWDPVAEQFGAFPLIFGTLLSSVVALVIAVPLSLGVAIYLVEFAPKGLRQPVAFLISLLAAIPQDQRLPVPPRRPRLSSALPGADLRSLDARGRHHPRHHDHALCDVGEPGGPPRGAGHPA
jgi:hypothetical protein